MKTLYALLSAFVLYAQTASALLPPLFQNLDELKTILNDPGIGRRLQAGEPIEAIVQTSRGYMIYTNKHKMLAEVVSEHTGYPGKAKFHILFHKPEPLLNE